MKITTTVLLAAAAAVVTFTPDALPAQATDLASVSSSAPAFHQTGGGDRAGVLSTAQPMGLDGCPPLALGRRDPVNGRKCVQALQLALRANGYPEQAVTGYFGEQTRARVLAFQRRRTLPADGIAGPRTQAALLGIPVVTQADFSGKRFYCQGFTCHFYVRRASTAAFAGWLDKHPFYGSIASEVLIAGACTVVRINRSLRQVCEIVGGALLNLVVDQVKTALKSAAAQRACLRLSIGVLSSETGGVRPFQAAPDNTRRCFD